MDPWMIQPSEKSRFHAQFLSLNPVNNHVTGDQAKGLFLKSGLPVQVLGKIWTLADRDADGRMDISEFSIACKLITLKLKGQELPATLPPSLLASSAGSTAPSPTTSLPSAMLSQNFIQPAIPAAGVSATSNVNLLMNGNGLLSQAPVITPAISKLPVLPLAGAVPGVGTLPPTGVPLSAMPAAPAPSLVNTVQPMTSVVAPMMPLAPSPAVLPPMSAVPIVPAHPQSLPVDPIRTVPSLPSQDSQCSSGSVLSPSDNWSVPHSTKLKNTQLFNTHDRVKSGFLSGPQARHILVQTGLPQAVLAQIWTLADVSSDGKLSCDEFVLAMHLCDLVRMGGKLPVKLPPDLVPPQYRKTRLNSQGSLQDVMSGGETPDDVKIIPAMMTAESRQDSQTDVTFEDKRKENFERGQAELERRRRALLEIQQREEEERQRKEREEQEKRERLRLEAEEKRRQEMERQLARQRELEAQREEERRRKLEQQEAARKEMERQRQLEWEKQRRQELLQQRQREQEKVLQLKAQNQKLAIELTQVNDKVRELTDRIGDTREGVTSVKTVIDGMRTTRDTKVAEMNRYKALLKEHNAALLQLAQEKSRLQERNKVISTGWHDDTVNNMANTVVNRTLALKQLRDKLELYGEEKRQKILDLETASGQLEDLKDQLHQLIISSKSVYGTYQLKRGEVYNMKYSTKPAWDVSAPAHTPLPGTNGTQTQKYRVVYQFDARNEDELSLTPGDIVLVHHDRPAEPHWLVGELDNGKSGWFPESYVEPCDESAVTDDSRIQGISEVPNEAGTSSGDGFVSHPEVLPSEGDAQHNLFQGTATERVIGTDWSGEQEDQLTVREGDVVSVTQDQDGWSYGDLGGVSGWFPSSCIRTVPADPLRQDEAPLQEGEYCVALYNYHSQEDADLNFKAGDVIRVVKKDGDWWTGTLHSHTGIFPYNYVQPHPQPPAQEQETGSTQVKGKKPEIATVIAPYQPTGEGQLNLQRGQLILVKRKTNSGWWEGELQAKGKKRQMGWFPASYVKLMGNPKGHSQTTDVSDTILDKDDPPIPDSAPPQLEAERDGDWSQQAEVPVTHGSVEALYPYTAQNSDELSFQKGDVIKILDNSDAAWWKGEMNGREGMFPCNYVGPLKEDDGSALQLPHHVMCTLSVKERKRQGHIHELIDTEYSYVKDMKLVAKVFLEPLRESRLVTRDEVDRIFINWSELICCNSNLLKALKIRCKMSSTGVIHVIGDILCENIPHFTPYIRFCSCQLNAAALIQEKSNTCPEFRNLTRQLSTRKSVHGMPLTSFLIKPMQRITKYPLMIRKILEYTPREHSDRGNLEEAVRRAEELCCQVNEGVRERENSDCLEWMQQHVQCPGLKERIVFNSLTNLLGPRKFLHYGVVYKVKSGKELIAFLLNDFLLLTQPSKPIPVGKSFVLDRLNCDLKMYKVPLFLNGLIHGSKVTVKEGEDPTHFTVKTFDQEMYLKCMTVTERQTWVKKVTEAVNKYEEAETQLSVYRKVLPATSPPQGRLLVLIQEGLELKPIEGLARCNPYCQVSLGCHVNNTEVIHLSNNPKWNTSMQFLVYNIEQDVLSVTLYHKEYFSPDEFLGRSEVKISAILRETRATHEPVTKCLTLQETSGGQIIIRLDLQLFENK